MKVFFATLCGLLIVTLIGANDANANPGCKTVSGHIFELEIPANELNNPVNHGRVVGVVTGALYGVETAILTGFAPPPPNSPPGAFAVTTQNVFVTKEGDMLATSGVAVIAFNPDGTVAEELTLVANGGLSTGQFTGATGTIELTGAGFNFGGGPGLGQSEFEYHGQICTP